MCVCGLVGVLGRVMGDGIKSGNCEKRNTSIRTKETAELRTVDHFLAAPVVDPCRWVHVSPQHEINQISVFRASCLPLTATSLIA